MKKSAFTGTGVALVTPFKKDDSIDFRALTNVVEHVIKNGVEYLVALGTTGETPVLSNEEQLKIIHHVKKVNEGRLPLVVGMGGNDINILLRFRIGEGKELETALLLKSLVIYLSNLDFIN